MEGKVKESRKNRRGNITGYDIEGNDGKTYFAHVGDIQENENLLYEIRDHKLGSVNTAYDHFSELKKNEKVNFKGWDGNSKLHAFNVKRAK